MKISTLRQIQLSQVSNVDKNNKETYISHAAQLLRNASYAKKSVWGIYSITYTAKKYLWSICTKCHPYGIHLPCHVIAPRIYHKHCISK